MDTVDKFMRLFSGNQHAYITFDPTGGINDKGKVIGILKTVHKQVQREQFERHINGIQGITIIPIRPENNDCLFGAIDVDGEDWRNQQQYLLTKIDKLNKSLLNTQLYPFQSKSGQMHIYLFFSQPIPAKEVREKLRMIANYLGLSKRVEIFPKQDILNPGDTGNGINLPYFGDTRQMFNLTQHTLEDVIDNWQRCNLSDTNQLKVFDRLCLGYVIGTGLESGRSNDVLLNINVAAKGNQTIINLCNNLLIAPQKKIEFKKSGVNKDKGKYTFSCKLFKELIGHGNFCKDCHFHNVSAKDQDTIARIKMGEITQYGHNEPYYIWNINGIDLKFDTATDLLNFNKFQAMCIDKLHIVPTGMNPIEYQRRIQKSLDRVKIVDIKEGADLSVITKMNMTVQKILDSSESNDMEDLLGGICVYNGHTEQYYVASSTIAANYRINFPNESPKAVEIQEAMRRLNAQAIDATVAGKPITVWVLKSIRQQLAESNFEGDKFNEWLTTPDSDTEDF